MKPDASFKGPGRLVFKFDFNPGDQRRIPSWVPNSVAEVARRNFTTSQHEILIPDGYEFRPPDAESLVYDLPEVESLFRLVCDQRMRGVWRELSRRRRNGAFLHPAEQQDAAMAELFSAAVRCTFRAQTAVTCRQAKQNHRELTEKADELLADGATLLFRMVIRDGYATKHGERLNQIATAARALKEIAAENLAIEMRRSSATTEREKPDGLRSPLPRNAAPYLALRCMVSARRSRPWR
jgi:hypothetical protein